MKENPLKHFLECMYAVLSSLSLSVKGAELYPYVSAYHYMGYNKVHAHIEIIWQAKIDFEICAESALRRLFCRLAHGDECGSAAYVSLRKTAKKAYSEILKLLKESELEKRSTHSAFEMGRDRIWLHFNISVDMNEKFLSPELQAMINNIISSVQKSETAIQTFNIDNSTLIFVGYQESLSKELGIKKEKVKAEYTA
jgi:hypothetical protein